MREIKYRGLNEETGKWVYGWYTKLVEGIRRFDAIISDVDGELTRFYIHNKETIGQFTGLHDKNGKEIYEGDIISGFVVTYCADSKEGLGMQSGWYIQRDNFESWEPLDSRCNENGDNWEVIGNIHE